MGDFGSSCLAVAFGLSELVQHADLQVHIFFHYYGDDPVDHGDVHNNKGEMILCVIFHPWDNEIILGE